MPVQDSFVRGGSEQDASLGFLLDRNVNFYFSLFGKFDGIPDQVKKHLPQTRGIGWG